eukprot:scaffold1866_cov276-Prasinococcus_capsulatus_cf.AAC.2
MASSNATVKACPRSACRRHKEVRRAFAKPEPSMVLPGSAGLGYFPAPGIGMLPSPWSGGSKYDLRLDCSERMQDEGT